MDRGARFRARISRRRRIKHPWRCIECLLAMPAAIERQD
jgi:hypothetical protein